MTKKQRRKEPAKSAPEARGGGNLTASERTVLKKLAQAEARKEKKKDEKKLFRKLEKRFEKKKQGSTSSSCDSDSDSGSDTSSSSDSDKKKTKKKASKQSRKKKSKLARLQTRLQSEAAAKEAAEKEVQTLKDLVAAHFDGKNATEPAGESGDQPEFITRDEFLAYTTKAKESSKPSSPVKPGIFGSLLPKSDSSSVSSGIIEKLKSRLTICAEKSDLSSAGPEAITPEASKLATKAAKLSAQKYFSSSASLTALQEMVQGMGLGTNARNGNTIIVAILKAAISRGQDIPPEDLGLKLKDLRD